VIDTGTYRHHDLGSFDVVDVGEETVEVDLDGTETEVDRDLLEQRLVAGEVTQF